MSNENAAAQNNTNAATDSQVTEQVVTKQADAQQTANVTPSEVTKETTPTETAQATPEAPQVPEKYELKLSEGSLLDQSKLDEISSYAKEHKLTQEQAQNLLNREESAVKEYHETLNQQHVELVDKWRNEVASDKEIGGANFNQNVEYAHRALDKFASPELKQILDKTGYGNHPELVRAFYKIGKAMADDKFIFSGANQTQTKSMEEIFYGSNN